LHFGRAKSWHTASASPSPEVWPYTSVERSIASALLGALIATFRPRASLAVEILVLRQRLAVFQTHPAMKWVAQQIVEAVGPR
jgi:hypothetical protein